MKKILFVDKVLYFLVYVTPYPLFYSILFYSCIKYDNSVKDKNWLDTILIFILPLALSAAIIRIRMWLFVGFANSLRLQIKSSKLLVEEKWDDSTGYSFRVKESINQKVGEIDFYCNYSESKLTATPYCVGSKSYAIRFFIHSGLESIIEYVTYQDKKQTEKNLKYWRSIRDK
ncbi:MAG: hypothetical protein RL108_105 [Bacteroidota bacterium]|jgi:hypothetical protein